MPRAWRDRCACVYAAGRTGCVDRRITDLHRERHPGLVHRRLAVHRHAHADAGACAGSCVDRVLHAAVRRSIACDPEPQPLPNACLTEDAGDPGCPPGWRASTTFCIDRFEAALVDVDGSAWSPYVHPGRATRARGLAARCGPAGVHLAGRRPRAACAAAGKRLCSDAEWLRACQGPTTTTYPYGNTREPGVCNDARAQHPADRALRHERRLDLLPPRQPVPEPGGRTGSRSPARTPAASRPRARST